jgi:hypothetical protein
MKEEITIEDLNQFSHLFHDNKVLISCHKGWYRIIYNFLLDLDALVKSSKFNIELWIIKEKFSTIRINYQIIGEITEEEKKYLYILEDISYNKSVMTCESCGAVNNIGVISKGWFKRVCKKCKDDLSNKEHWITIEEFNTKYKFFR